MRLAGIVKESIVDGPGIRLVIFFQGCSHHCLKCHNPHSWNKDGGYESNIQKIEKLLIENKYINGVTISGGEPFEQKESLFEIVQLIKSKYEYLDLIVYTGYTYEELTSDIDKKILAYIDYLVDGKFVFEERDISLLFRGSTNQRFIDVQKTLKNKKVITLSDDEIKNI